MNQTSMHPDLRDQLAEVLKDLVVGQEITKERAQAALAQHNKSHASTADAAKEVSIILFCF